MTTVRFAGRSTTHQSPMTRRSNAMSRRLRIALALAGILVSAAVGPAWAESPQRYSIDWHVISSGGGPASAGEVSLNLTVGQSAIGIASSDGGRVDLGYWYGRHTWVRYLPILVKGEP